jgi:hypothetical protein
LTGIPVEKPQEMPLEIDPFTEVSVFSGVRTLTSGAGTEYALTISSLSSSTYRLKWTGTGLAPGFRTARTVALTAGTITLTLQSNSTVVVTHSAGAVFGTVVVGDTFYIPGVTTGDASLFDSLNEGSWNVISASTTTLVISRATGTVFQGKTETVAITTADQVQIFSAAGVQVGDVVDISGGFSVATQGAYEVLSVTSKQIEFISTVPLAAQTVVAGTAVALYSAAKRYVYVETSQSISLKFNGDTGDFCRVEPVVAGDDSKVGPFEKWGPAYSLSIKNRSATTAKVFVVVAE